MTAPGIPTPNPERVAIVAMGRSAQTFITYCSQRGGYKRNFDEVWTINAMGGVICHDRAFISDDLMRILEPKVKADPECMTAGMLEWARIHPGPVYTAKAYPQYPGSVEYPLQDVIRSTGTPYLNTTVAYAMAFALHLGVKHIALYGCDFSYPDFHVAESGRGCCEFLIGLAAARGIDIELPSDTTLMDSGVPEGAKFYGYADPVGIKRDPESGQPVVVHGKQEPEPEPAAVAAIERPEVPKVASPLPPVVTEHPEPKDDIRPEVHSNGHDAHDCLEHVGSVG